MFGGRIRVGRGLVLALVVAAVFQAGVVAATLSEPLRKTVLDTKHVVGVVLGVPKKWHPTPRLADYEPRTEVPCPSPAEAALVVTGGQSNAANALSTRTPQVKGSRVVMFFDGKCYPHEDPVLGASNAGGSLWVELGAALEGQIGRPIVFVHGAMSGTRFSEWNDLRSGYLDALLGNVSAAMDRGYRAPVILWHQGETDAAVMDDPEAFKDDVRRLLSTLQARVPGSSIYLFQTSRCKNRDGGMADGDPRFPEAERQVGAEFANVTLGMDTDSLDLDHRHDGCHFNGFGRSAIVREAVPRIASLIEATKPSDGPAAPLDISTALH